MFVLETSCYRDSNPRKKSGWSPGTAQRGGDRGHVGEDTGPGQGGRVGGLGDRRTGGGPLPGS